MTDLNTGLTQQEVAAQLHKFGFNEFEERRALSVVGNVLKILGDPMGLMLFSLSVIYWVLGQHHDAIVLLIAYFPIVGVDVILELRSQKALRSLKRTLKAKCKVIRDGKNISILTRNLVPGVRLRVEILKRNVSHSFFIN